MPTSTTTQAQRRRLQRGRDWHGWAWKDAVSGFRSDTFIYRYKPKFERHGKGAWCQVHFTEVSRSPRRGRP